jgi:hypothetical protein
MSEVSSDGINPEGAEHSVMHRNLGLAAQKFSNGILEPIEERLQAKQLRFYGY